MGYLLDIKAEVHDVSVLHDILFALDAHLAGLLDGSLGAQSDVVFVLDNLGTDESLLKVGVYDAGTLRSLAATHERPCPAFVCPCGEVGLEVEELISSTDQTIDSRL